MPINQNHLFEELDGVKCSIVEKNASKERVEFLKNLLEPNGYTVVVAATLAAKPVPAKPVPKPAPAVTSDGTAPAPAATSAPVTPADATASPIAAPAATATPEAPPPPPPSTFTVGVTDLIFNPTNAIFGRLLRTPDGHVVTLAYWQQKEEVPHDEIPYYEKQL